MLENLKGIKKDREVKEREKTNLEKLLETEKDIVESYFKADMSNHDKTNQVYLSIYRNLKKEKLKGIEFDENDLRSLLFARANNDYVGNESKVLGLYTGSLLHLLTERNKVKGKRTRFYINGQGNRFDYLFYFAKEVDELVVENFGGDYICGGIGSNNGIAKLVVMKDIEGNFVGEGIGSNEGRAELVVMKDIKGNNAGRWLASNKGGAGLVVMKDIEGDFVGGGIASNKGGAELVLMKDIEGDYAGWVLGDQEGKVELVLMKDIKGNIAGGWIGNKKGRAELVVMKDIEGSDAGWVLGNNEGKVGLVYHNVPHISEEKVAEKIISGEEALKKYQNIIQNYKIEEMWGLVDNMKGKNEEEIIRLAEQINTIYVKTVKDEKKILESLSFHQSMTGGRTNLEKMRGDRASVSERACHPSMTGGVSEHFDSVEEH